MCILSIKGHFNGTMEECGLEYLVQRWFHPWVPSLPLRYLELPTLITIRSQHVRLEYRVSQD